MILRWCPHFSLRSSLWKRSKKNLIWRIIFPKIAHFGRVSLWALPYGGDFSDPKWSDSLIATIFNKFLHVPPWWFLLTPQKNRSNTQHATRNTQHAHATRNNARNNRTQQTHATNARTQQTRSTPNKIRKHAKSRTTAEKIAYRTNQLPVGAQVFAPTACNPTKCRVTPYRGENLSLFPHTFETRSSREIA